MSTYKSFSGRSNDRPGIDPSAGPPIPNDSASIRRACANFLRQREPGFAQAQDAMAAARSANRSKAPNPHARG